MTRTQLLALTASLAAVLSAPGMAQGAKMIVRPESKVALAGSSNVHDWECTSGTLNAQISLDASYETVPLTEVAKPISRVSVDIPVKTLKCGHGKMDDNMYKALKADQNPDIKYVLESYEIDKTKTTADSFAALTTGELTVAGQTRKVEIPVTAVRGSGGAMKGEGTLNLRMTDFGIKPPVALLGTLRTKDEIKVSFTVLLDKSALVALQQR